MKNLKRFLIGLLMMTFFIGTMSITAFAAENVWHGDQVSREVKKGEDGYTFLSVYPGRAYEMSNHMVTSNGGKFNSIPQTLVLIDANEDYTWTPDGPYVFGQSNYEVLYCCDRPTGYEDNIYYKRVNLEDSTYYSPETAKQIRAIVMNSYPFVTVEEMKANLAEKGFIGAEELTRAEIITAVQSAIWSYANGEQALYYSRTFDVPTNSQWGTVFHDYTNEMDVWWESGERVISTNDEVAARINGLTQFLRELPAVEATDAEIVVNKIEVLRAEPVAMEEDLFTVYLRVILNGAGDADDNIRLTVTSESVDGVTGTWACGVKEDNIYEVAVKAKYGDKITAVVEGTQVLPRGAYLYEPKGGRDVSQTLVGVGMGETDVYAEKSFVYAKDIDMGIRIFKSSSTTGEPLSDITFTVYEVNPETDDTISSVPTEEEIAKYKTESNMVASVTTDECGYAYLGLEKGIYLVVEEHNEEKVEAPINPFYVSVPMYDYEADENIDIVAIYPKNTPTPPPEEPDPEILRGNFKILKHRTGNVERVLSGAKFQVYRPISKLDTQEDIVTITCDGEDVSVVPVTVDGENMILTTGDDGTAVSPQLKFGAYYVVETEAPFGYQLDNNAVRVLVVDGIRQITYEIANNTLVKLPETGGIGTTIFTVTGSLMILAAVALLLHRKRFMV